MALLKNLIGKIGSALNTESVPSLSAFQEKKIMHEFHTFYDLNKDGTLQWKDFEESKNYIIKLNGWKPGSTKFLQTQELFIELWNNLQDMGDENCDGKITVGEWVKMWTSINLSKLKTEEAAAKLKLKTMKTPEKDREDGGTKDMTAMYVPEWFERYMAYKFNLYDRMGDGIIDADEFEYTLCDGFNMCPKECRAAFTLFSQGGHKKVDFPYFRELALDFYLSTDSGALGNFINGRLSYDD